jgi:hypothetical protein
MLVVFGGSRIASRTGDTNLSKDELAPRRCGVEDVSNVSNCACPGISRYVEIDPVDCGIRGRRRLKWDYFDGVDAFSDRRRRDCDRNG